MTLSFGYGRDAISKVGKEIGSNINPLRASTALWAAVGAVVRATGERRALATTQHYRTSCEPAGSTRSRKKRGNRQSRRSLHSTRGIITTAMPGQ
jgi:hypothetical protein